MLKTHSKDNEHTFKRHSDGFSSHVFVTTKVAPGSPEAGASEATGGFLSWGYPIKWVGILDNPIKICHLEMDDGWGGCPIFQETSK